MREKAISDRELFARNNEKTSEANASSLSSFLPCSFYFFLVSFFDIISFSVSASLFLSSFLSNVSCISFYLHCIFMTSVAVGWCFGS